MSTDPRDLGGSIVGPGGPFDEGGVVLDTSKALIVDFREVCEIDGGMGGERVFAVLLEGRVNRTQARASVLCIESLDGLAALITEAHGLAERAGIAAELAQRCRERWAEMPHR